MEDFTTFTERKILARDALDCVRWLALKASLGTGSDEAVLPFFEQKYPRSSFVVERHKAAVPPVTTTDGGVALLPPSTDPIIALVQQQTLPTRLGLPIVPFNVPVPTQNALGTYSWALQNTPKPVSRITWTSVTNPAGKITGIVPVSRELVKLSPKADGAITAALTRGAVKFSDEQFLDPAVTFNANGRPASITNGVVPITATGTTLAAKVRELLTALFANRPETSRPALIATPGVVSALTPNEPLTLAGGTFAGVPVYTSPAAGTLVVALDIAGVVFSDDGGIVETSEEATVILDTAPVENAAAVPTSFWQSNFVGFRVDRYLWWQKVAANAVQVLTSGVAV